MKIVRYSVAECSKLRRELMVAQYLAIEDEVNSGKTTALLSLLEVLRQEGYKIGGVVQPAMYEGERKVGYMLEDLLSAEQRQLVIKSNNGCEFKSEVWSWGREVIMKACGACDLVVVDELGRLEARGAGHMPAIHESMEKFPTQHWLFTIRKFSSGGFSFPQ